VGGHEIDDLRRDLLRRDGEVAFVFPVFIVHHHHDAAGAISSMASGTERKA
jgi:hypothetical protein